MSANPDAGHIISQGSQSVNVKTALMNKTLCEIGPAASMILWTCSNAILNLNQTIIVLAYGLSKGLWPIGDIYRKGVHVRRQRGISFSVKVPC